MIITNTQTIDLKAYQSANPINAAQDDRYSRNVELILMSGGEPWIIPEDASVLIRYAKPDGTGGVYDTLPDETPAWSAEENILTVVLAPQVLTVPGAVSLSITLFRAQQQLSTCSLIIHVAAVANGDCFQSEDDAHVHCFLPAPATAQPGQLIHISAVDSGGHVVAVEAVDASAGDVSNTDLSEKIAQIEPAGNSGFYAQPSGLIQEQTLEMYLHEPIKLNKNMKILRMLGARVNPYIAKVVYSNSPTLEKWSTLPVVVLEGNEGDIIDCDIEIDTNYQYMYIATSADSSGYIQDDNTTYFIISAAPETRELIHLADRYDIAPGDSLELFYEGIIWGGNRANHLVECRCSVGHAYQTRFVYTPEPEDAGNTYLFSVTLRDHLGNLLAMASSQIHVTDKRLCSLSGNILCIGDSLTAEGSWVREFRNLLSADGFENALLIGSQGSGEAKHEGHSGFGYGSYLAAASENPFWNTETGQMDFPGYMEKLGLAGQAIDHCILLLGWNETALTEAAFKENVEAFCAGLRSAYPNCRLLFVGLQIPSWDGLGSNYGCAWSWPEKCDFVHDLDRWYRDIVSATANSRAVQLCSQFDSGHNMPTGLRQVNRRNPAQESYGTNGIHPNQYGYLQIADAVYRAFLGF